jgi:hypothetical protein
MPGHRLPLSIPPGGLTANRGPIHGTGAEGTPTAERPSYHVPAVVALVSIGLPVRAVAPPRAATRPDNCPGT